MSRQTMNQNDKENARNQQSKERRPSRKHGKAEARAKSKRTDQQSLKRTEKKSHIPREEYASDGDGRRHRSHRQKSSRASRSQTPSSRSNTPSARSQTPSSRSQTPSARSTSSAASKISNRTPTPSQRSSRSATNRSAAPPEGAYLSPPPTISVPSPRPLAGGHDETNGAVKHASSEPKLHSRTKSWSKIKDWMKRQSAGSRGSGRVSDPGAVTVANSEGRISTGSGYVSGSGKFGVSSENPIARREMEKTQIHRLSQANTRPKPKTLSAQLDKKRFELDVPQHMRKKSVASAGMVALEKARLEAEKERERVKSANHRKKSSLSSRRAQLQFEPPNPAVATESFLPSRPVREAKHIQSLNKALERAQNRVAEEQQTFGLDFVDVDSDLEDDEDEDAEAMRYYKRKSMGRLRPRSNKEKYGVL